ncbi:MAG: MauE/DoxX family redox-associated membrane protein [Chthoniobacterales bacterium]
MTIRVPGLVLRVCRVVLGGLFMFAGVTKAYDPAGFATEIQNYQLLPWVGCVLLALFLPWVEVLAGGSLFLKGCERGALLLISTMLVAFSAALISAMVRGLNIDCGCFGRAIPSTGVVWPLIRNVGLMILAGMLWIGRARGSGEGNIQRG